MAELALNIKKTIHAPVENVFNAWLDANTLSKFMTPMPGMPEPRVESDGIQGGRFAIYMMVQGKEVPHTGRYLEVDPYSKLSFSWESPSSVDGSTVTLLFNRLADGNTEIELNHVKFLGQQERDNHEGGWTEILNKLNTIAETLEITEGAIS